MADNTSDGDSVDSAAKEELKALCDAADFDQLSVAAQVDFKHSPGGHVLQSFLRFGARECPADRYVVFFYDYAFGPMGLFFDNDRARPTPTTMGLPARSGSLESIERRAAVVVFRDCLVNTLETAYELRGVAEFMIATQALAPIAGVWPWDTFRKTLMPGAPSGDIAKAIGLQLGRFLDKPVNRDPFANVPFSLIDLEGASAVVEPLTALTAALELAGMWTANNDARSYTVLGDPAVRLQLAADGPGDETRQS